MTDDERYDETVAMHQAFLHVYYEDRANAAMHCATVRYSPITFRLAECLRVDERQSDLAAGSLSFAELVAVWSDVGAYPEDPGR